MTRFVEKVSIDSKLIKKVEVEGPLREKLAAAIRTKRLDESIADAPSAWEVPISRYDVLNENRRLYPRALWERVINEQRHVWEGAPMLADHPAGDSDGSPEKICGVWLEARVGNDGYVYGTFVPSGRLGEDLQDHLLKGLKAGTSSSGFGDLMEDRQTVDPKTFMIERLSDWVLTPSQGTYFKYEGTETKNASDSQRLGESANKPESVVKENATMGKLTKLEEKRFRKDMVSFLEGATKLTNPQERLEEFTEILGYLEDGACPDLREQIVAKIDEEKASIARKLENADKLANELGIQDADELREKLTVIAEDAAILQEEAKDWKAIAASLQTKLDEARVELMNRPTNAYVQHLRGKVNKLYKENKDVQTRARQQAAKLVEASKKKDKVLEAIDSEIGAHENIVNEQRTKIEQLVLQLEESAAKLKATEAKVAAVTKEFQEYKSHAEAAPKLMESPAALIAKYGNFREGDRVDAYWADLALRHGKDIKPFEEKIRSSKTVREAQAMYFKVLPFLNESRDYEAARIPESVALDLHTRASMLREAGVNIQLDSDVTTRLPEGWV